MPRARIPRSTRKAALQDRVNNSRYQIKKRYSISSWRLSSTLYYLIMALISPASLATLHAVGSAEIAALQGSPSGRYAYIPGKKDQVCIVPDAALFRCLPTTDPGPKALPTASECAVHLEMLEVFRALRDAVIQSNELDKAFGISPQKKVRYRKKREGWKYVAVPVEIRDPAWEDRRKLKWKYYLSIAAARFHMWINLVNEHLGKAAVGAPPLKELLLPPLGECLAPYSC